MCIPVILAQLCKSRTLCYQSEDRSRWGGGGGGGGDREAIKCPPLPLLGDFPPLCQLTAHVSEGDRLGITSLQGLIRG